MSGFSEAHAAYIAIRERWLAAERAASDLRLEMIASERRRKEEWDRLIEACRELTPEEQALEAKRQFGALPT